MKSLLMSLQYYSDAKEENIHIVYKADEGVSYDPLIKDFKCKFHKQKNFLEDVTNIIRYNDSDYIWFMVDDLIYRDTFSIREIEDFLDDNPNVDSFCLRLGKNITANDGQPYFEKDDKDILTWNTKFGQGKHWNYFWELSSSVYRRNLVLQYISKCRPKRETFPNPFEYHYYSCMPNTRTRGPIGIYLKLRYPLSGRSKKVACFKNSKCFTHGVNLVADLKDERKETFSFKELHRKMLDGYAVDFVSPTNIETPNPGGKFFKIVKIESLQNIIKNNEKTVNHSND
ncbi:MAG TPA: hypothetical protein PK821_00430 [Victivallales bacterium]|nr:hypothetical protein [Victivallales bacterium]